MRSLVLDEGLRADGRGVTDIRPITSRAAVLPCTHGSALFTRGETQVGGWRLRLRCSIKAFRQVVRGRRKWQGQSLGSGMPGSVWVGVGCGAAPAECCETLCDAYVWRHGHARASRLRVGFAFKRAVGLWS